MPHALEVPHAEPILAAQARRGPLEAVGDLLDLTAGAVAAWMPFLLLSMPAIVLFVILPLMLAAIPAVLVAALLAPPFLLYRAARRWGR